MELLFRLVKVDPEGRHHSRQRVKLAEAVAVAGGGAPGACPDRPASRPRAGRVSGHPPDPADHRHREWWRAGWRGWRRMGPPDPRNTDWQQGSRPRGRAASVLADTVGYIEAAKDRAARRQRTSNFRRGIGIPARVSPALRSRRLDSVIPVRRAGCARERRAALSSLEPLERAGAGGILAAVLALVAEGRTGRR